MKDYYAILGISSSAKHIEVRRAYRKRALELHPEVNSSPKAKEAFIELNEAYQVLKNVQSRIRYDRLRKTFHNRKETQTNSDQEKNNQKRENSQNKRAQSGRQKGEKATQKSTETVKRRNSWWAILDVFAFIVDLIGIFG